ncbi:hypothetical protein I4F81_008976 [Pyropia yezoensis]|uniref:Uncharacterized protein n=1 Tax=Pyropia yezoensis TaxID=2788 RepID=A0ACC3C9A3_PYRYE|nr:hypothetical protein I4F81_008976 [Neopyropia yezoensis]
MVVTLAPQGPADPPVASVSMEQRGLLSLGRAVLSRTDWLVGHGGGGGGDGGDGGGGNGTAGAAASPWALTAFVRMISESVNDDAADWDGVTQWLRARPPTYTTADRGGRPLRRPPPETYRNMSWTLDGVAGTGGLLQHSATLAGSVHTSWLAAIASVVCLAPAGRFVAHPRVCDGVPVSAEPYTAAPSSRLSALPLSVWPGRTQVQRADNVLWSVFNGVTAVDAPPAANGSATTYVPHFNDSTGLPRSSLSPSAGGWAGALFGPREVRTAAAAEGALAAALRSRRVLLPTLGAGDHTLPEVRGRLLTDRLRSEAAAALQAASVAYDARLFGVPPPAPPADASSVLLAALVVLSEAAALFSGRLVVARHSRREVASLATVWAAGCLSTSAVVWLAVEEVRGDGWRAAARRDALGVRWAATAADAPVADAKQFLAGAELARLEAFVMVARHGYRPRLLVGLAGGAVGAYALASAVILGSLTRWRVGPRGGEAAGGRRRRCWCWWSTGDGGGVPPASGAEEGRWGAPPSDDEDPFRQPPPPAELYRRPAAVGGGGGWGG